MIIFCLCTPNPCHRINVKAAELFAAFPTPGAPTAGADHKGAFALKPACKNVVAGCIFESPALTPGALLCSAFIVCHSF